MIIQAHLNENVMPGRCPHVPIDPAACVREGLTSLHAGAAIVHFHARDADGGQAPFDLEFYRTAARGLTSQSEVLWWPPQGESTTPQRRWAHVQALAEDPSAHLKIISIDPGSYEDMMGYDPTTKSTFSAIGDELRDPDASDLHASSVPKQEHWRWFCEEARRLRIKPIFGVLEPGYLRRVLAWYDMGLIDPPLSLHIFLTDRLSYGLPADVSSIDTYLSMIPASVPVEWFISPAGCTTETEQRLIDYAIDSGGHVRAGLGCPPIDASSARLSMTNADVIAEVGARSERRGRTVASVAEAVHLLDIQLDDHAVVGSRDPSTTQV